MDGEDSLSKWERIELLGQGGNGEVWKARRCGVECALKILKETNKNEESYRRFMDEIRVLRELHGHVGVLPILDANLPDHPSKKNRAWLAMPLATGIKKALGERPELTSVVEAVASIANTLADLADKGICHRDIKPENLYILGDEWVVGDFGLVDFPGKGDVTEEGRALGPRFYIAPEMVRDPINASGFPADVWSLAKTMWVLATAQNYPPPHPQPANDPNDTLASLVNHPRARLLDRLIEQATHKEPRERPAMRGFATELSSWLALSNEPTLETDVSDLTYAIRQQSSSYYNLQDRLKQSIEQANLVTTRLLEELNRLSENMRQTGLQTNEPRRNGQNLRGGTDLPHADHGDFGVTVSMFTPPPITHIFQCGVLIQVLNDRQHRLYAAHQVIPHKSGQETVWCESDIVDFGSSQAEHVLRQLVNGLYDNFRLGLERFRQVMLGSTEAYAGLDDVDGSYR